MTAPIVDLGYAQYQGYLDTQTNITNYLSIRYAPPPVGEYRIDFPFDHVHHYGRTDAHIFQET